MRTYSLTLAVALSILPVAQSALAQDSGSYRWERPDGSAQATLTLRGPKGDQQRIFAAGQAVQLDAAKLVDGLYRWELVYAPSVNDALKSAVAQRRAEGDSALPADWPEAIPTRSGVLRVNSGQFVAAVLETESQEPGPVAGVAKAAPITGDQTIYNSACIGSDCAAAESYGFDTLRFKENNLRMHFDDTSNTGSFPDNDWRIRINDTTNGGANYFAIEDSTAGLTPFLIEAGAINNALYVDSAGDVGIGTDVPVVEVHAVDGNTPTLRLQQDGSNGFTPYTFDLAANEANFFIRDVNTGQLPFRIRPGADNSSIDIAGSNNIGFSVANASAALHIRRNFASSYC